MTARQSLLPGMLLIIAACSSAKPEAAMLVASVDRFHRASNDDRPARADAITQVVCRDDDVCSAKNLCIEATTATATALRLKHEVELTLAEVESGKRDPGDPAAKLLAGKLDQASLLLKKGHDAMPACDQRILVLRERYGL
jgi:hypothetical protein